MRPILTAAALFSLAALPALAQPASPAGDRYGPASAPSARAVPATGYLNWAGKTSGVAASPAGRPAPPQLMANGVLSHTAAGLSAAPVASAPPAPAMPQAAPRPPVAPAAPLAPAPRAPAGASLSSADLAAMGAAAPEGLLGVAPPVREAQTAAIGAL